MLVVGVLAVVSALLLAACGGEGDRLDAVEAQLATAAEERTALTLRLGTLEAQPSAAEPIVANLDVYPSGLDRLLQDRSGNIIGVVIPYCVTYTLGSTTQELCHDLVNYTDATPAYLEAQNKFILDCFNPIAIGDVLPDCWRR